MEDRRPANRLAREKSPYLLQHAHNPVDWHPFGEEAIQRARAEDKPIFLSIGYSTCHWCHVMERESFEDPEIARLMNDLFVNIKVDREERPEIDQVYMQAVMAMTGQGGWPLSVWLTPELKPFYGGTYFPPERRFERPSFQEVLRGVAHLYRAQRQNVDESAEQLLAALQAGAGSRPFEGGLKEDLPIRLAGELEQSFDARFGGFGTAPKFPRPSALAFLAQHAVRSGSERAREMAGKTLEMMWRGGIYDHVGGGFARYSVDERWLVPHFEKMLYDQALLVEAYLDGYLLLERQDFADVAADVLAFIDREMTHPSGGFYSALDADSEGVEGKFYVLTLEDLRAALGRDAERAARIYGVTEEGNFEGANVLHWPRSPTETASLLGLNIEQLWALHEDFRKRLYAWRERRVRPGLDDKVLTSWNGLMIAALARAGVVLETPVYLDRAVRAADFIDSELRAMNGTLLRRWRDGEARFEASLEDHAFLAYGLLALFQATGASRWLARAIELEQEIQERYRAPDGGCYFAAESPDLPLRLKEAYDGAVPSGNSVLALVQSRLGAILGREDLRRQGLGIIEAFAVDLDRHPEGYPLMITAFAELREPPRTLVITGDETSAIYKGLLRQAHGEIAPGRFVILVPTAGELEAQAKLGVPLEGHRIVPGQAQALLCENASCRPWTLASRPAAEAGGAAPA